MACEAGLEHRGWYNPGSTWLILVLILILILLFLVLVLMSNPGYTWLSPHPHSDSDPAFPCPRPHVKPGLHMVDSHPYPCPHVLLCPYVPISFILLLLS